MNRITLSLILTGCCLSAGSALAVVPPDADARPQQIRSEYVYRKQMYEKRQAERQEQAVRAYEQTRENMFTPPWKRTQASSGVVKSASGAPEVQPEASEKKSHRFLVSLMLIALLVALAGWARYAPREIDK
jgi:hypothetical protein